jgi:hypothetical protein
MTADKPLAGSSTADSRVRVTMFLLLALILGLFGVAGCGGPDPSASMLPGQTRSASPAALSRARGWSAYLLAAAGTVPRGTGVFGLKDNLGQPMDCLRVIALQPGSYLGVYQVGTRNRFVVDLAVSSNLRTWRELQTLQPNASQPDLMAASGGFLLATEATVGEGPSPHAHYLDVRYYPSLVRLILGKPTRALVLPHRLAKPGSGVEGTPVIVAADLHGDLDHSTITITFHYLSADLVDREGAGVLTDFSTWSAQQDEPLDDALTHAGLDGKHGDRSFVPGTGDDLELVEAQRNSASPWEVYLYDRVSGAVSFLHIRTPEASHSFANPAIGCVPDPAGTTVAVVTFFLPNQQAGQGEAGELLYYRPSPLCAH